MANGRRTGYASLPLHGGKAPAWLFGRMVLLSREILAHLVMEYDKTIAILGRAVDRASIDHAEKRRALKRLAVFQP